MLAGSEVEGEDGSEVEGEYGEGAGGGGNVGRMDQAGPRSGASPGRSVPGWRKGTPSNLHEEEREGRRGRGKSQGWEKKNQFSIHVASTSPPAAEASPESRPGSSLQSQAALAPGRLLSSSSLLLVSATYCRVQGMTKRGSLVASIPNMLGGSPRGFEARY